MTENKDKELFRHKITSIILILLWTLVMVISLLWNIIEKNYEVEEYARIEARTTATKDIIIREWAMMREQIYVPISKNTKSNPYLTVTEKNIYLKSGKQYTLINPAFMNRQIHEIQKSKKGILGHLTSLNPIRPQNKPDNWEANALKKLEKGSSGDEISSLELLNNESYMRLMKPLITVKSCLRCHKHQGYKLGDIRGGISIAVPIAPIKKIITGHIYSIGIGHFFIWFFGIVGIVLWIRGSKNRIIEREKYTTELQIKNISIKESKEKLKERNSIMEKDLELAELVQNELLIKKIPESSFLKIDYRYLPLEKVGGDFFTFLQDGNDMGIFVGDVSGHGVASALFHSLINSSIKKISSVHIQNPSEFISSLNKDLFGHMTSYFITGIYGVFKKNTDIDSIDFVFSNGGHPYPIVIKKDGSIKSYNISGRIIGIVEDYNFVEDTISLSKGDRLFLFTDGIPETENANKEIIGFDDELLEIFKISKKATFDKSLDVIIDYLNVYRGVESFKDDIFLIGFEIV
jgi:serine phosphatase RsbU (regulator of sigma subunit)